MLFFIGTKQFQCSLKLINHRCIHFSLSFKVWMWGCFFFHKKITRPKGGKEKMSEGGRDDGDDEKMWKEAVARFVSAESGKQVHVGALNAVLVGVHRGALKLAALVELLGPSLTGRDEEERARGSLLLGEVLSRLPSLPLAPNDLQFLGD